MIVFGLALGFSVFALRVGWESGNLPGYEFRQAQTALSAYYLQQDGNFVVDYQTPVLGKPWEIPLEFPLYQWTVVAVSDFAGLGLVQAARAVSAVCFYLALPAVFLLLGQFGVASVRRWLALALILTSPLYLFYGRSFMIETMALMLTLWFAAAYLRAVTQRSLGWLVLAIVAGTGAGLVKVTTLALYLLPLAAWSAWRLWQGRRKGDWWRDFWVMAAAVALPLGMATWWEQHADAVRQLNPLASFLGSKNLRPFVFGTWPDRVSPQLWLAKWETTIQGVTWWPVLAAAGAALTLSTRQRILQGSALLLVYAAALVIFPVLYGFHDYYFMANGVLLLGACGVILAGVAERTERGGVVALAVLGMAAAQAWSYGQGYYRMQREIGGGGDALSDTLRALVLPDEMIVVAGQQWNPMTAYYSQRRAMMIRENEVQDYVRLEAAFAKLAGTKIGAVAIHSIMHDPAEILKRAVAFGISNQPICRWNGFTIFVRDDRRDEAIRQIQENRTPGLTWYPGVEPAPERLAAFWYRHDQLSAEKQALFAGMTPRPVRFYSSFGPALEYNGGRAWFGAHPVTRLIYAVPAGERHLRTTVSLAPETYGSDQPADRMTDGVELRLTVLEKNQPGKVVYSRVINPRDKPEDRGICEIEMPFTLAQAAEVELLLGPGPAGRDTHDSIIMGALEIK